MRTVTVSQDGLSIKVCDGGSSQINLRRACQRPRGKLSSTRQTVDVSLRAGNLGALRAVAFSPAHGTAVDPVFREFACELVFILKLVPEA